MRRRLFIAACLAPLYVTLQICAQVRYQLVNPVIVKTRLDLYKGNDQVREAALFKTFSDAGCPAANLSEQRVPRLKTPNVICVLPGDTPDEIIIGAHLDHVPQGSGVVDNWSGASLLPSFLQGLLASKHKHTYVFIGFSGEEEGLIGSTYYVKHLSKNEVGQIALMITIDSIGLGPTKVWVRRSDKQAVALLNATAQAMSLPLAGVNVDGVGKSDEEPFIQRGVKTVMIHSLTNLNIHVLHSGLDAPAAINFHDYYDTYRLLTGYLALLDTQLNPDAPPTSTQNSER